MVAAKHCQAGGDGGSKRRVETNNREEKLERLECGEDALWRFTSGQLDSSPDLGAIYFVCTKYFVPLRTIAESKNSRE